MTGATSGVGTAYPSGAPEFPPPVFSGIRVTWSLVLCVCFVDRRCLSFWPLCCLFFFDLRILITPLVSSNSSSYNILCRKNKDYKNSQTQDITVHALLVFHYLSLWRFNKDRDRFFSRTISDWNQLSQPIVFSCYKPSDKSSMRKRTGLWLWQKEHIRDHLWEEFEDTKGVMRICQSKRNRRYNEQKIKDKQWSTKHTHTTKDRVIPTPLIIEVNSGAPEG